MLQDGPKALNLILRPLKKQGFRRKEKGKNRVTCLHQLYDPGSQQEPSSIVEADEAQRACLRDFLHMDRLCPGNRNREGQGSQGVERQLDALNNNGMRHVGAWLFAKLRPHMPPSGGRLLPNVLIDEAKVEFREKGL